MLTVSVYLLPNQPVLPSCSGLGKNAQVDKWSQMLINTFYENTAFSNNQCKQINF